MSISLLFIKYYAKYSSLKDVQMNKATLPTRNTHMQWREEDVNTDIKIGYR